MGIRLMREPHADEFSTGRLYRRSGTSAEAAAGAAESARLHDTHRTIWAALKRKARTPDELARDLGMVLNTVRARCTELLQAGWVSRTGERRATGAGRAADVLRAVTKDRATT